MKKNDDSNDSHLKFSRRNFLTTAGVAAAGIVLNPFSKSQQLFAQTQKSSIVTPVKVGVAAATDYDPVTLKTKIQGLFEDIGGISDLAKAGNKVAIKINLTGGTGSTIGNSGYTKNLKGVSVVESLWTHPEVLRAVGQLLIDGGVHPTDIYFVEALWDQGSYSNNSFGYKDSYQSVQQSLGVNFIDLNKVAPYASFVDVPVGANAYYYSTLKFNQILKDVDVFISIPKMKEHRTAGFTNGMKILIGSVPLSNYQLASAGGYRSQLHMHIAGGNSFQNLPRTICDLNMARPIHLVVADGIKNSRGGELAYDTTIFRTCTDNVLIVGRDAVAVDAIAAQKMGHDPEAATIPIPGSQTVVADSYLVLAHNAGIGTNQLSEIQVVGTTGVALRGERDAFPDRFVLSQNWPNPFNPTTIIHYYAPKSAHVTLKIYNSLGREIETIVNQVVSQGSHQLEWNARNLSSGVYFCRMQAENYSETIKMVYEK